MRVWLGGLFNPEAYITATRQFVAQTNGWSLEELNLSVTIEDPESKQGFDDCSFALAGLKLQGAKSFKNKLSLESSVLTDLPLVYIQWIRTNAFKHPPRAVSYNQTFLISSD